MRSSVDVHPTPPLAYTHGLPTSTPPECQDRGPTDDDREETRVLRRRGLKNEETVVVPPHRGWSIAGTDILCF